MLKYTEEEVTFSEFPDEITLCLNITNCPHMCKSCHSPHLREDIGTVLDHDEIDRLVKKNNGITCIGIMGGDRNPEEVNKVAMYIKANYDLKVGWYSGSETLSSKIDRQFFDYIKIGPYIEEMGPLNKSTTNQIMYENVDGKLIDITWKFWR